MDGEHDPVPEVVPVLVGELDGQGDELLGEAVPAGYAEGFLQPGRDGTFVLRPVLPEHGIPAILPALSIGDVKDISEKYPAVSVAEQGYSLGAPPDAAAHAVVPEVEPGAGGGVGPLGVDHDLVHEAVLLKILSRKNVRKLKKFDG